MKEVKSQNLKPDMTIVWGGVLKDVQGVTVGINVVLQLSDNTRQIMPRDLDVLVEDK